MPASLVKVESGSLRDGPAKLFHLGYRRPLDGLRGVSILAVMSVHAGFNSRAGFIGVEMFFVLSGFLITCLLIEEWDQSGTISLSGFYARRALRLLPALVAMLLFVTLYNWLFLSKEIAREVTRDALVALFYSTNWVRSFGHNGASLFGHTWSLSIEEQFYFIWPLLLLLLLRRTRTRASLLSWVMLGVFLSVLARVLWDAALMDWNRFYFGTDTRAGALLMGSAVAVVLTSALLPRNVRFQKLLRYAAVLSVSALIFLNFWQSRYPSLELHVMFFLIPFLAAVILLHIVSAETGILPSILSQGWLVYIGRLSYGLYLWHLPIFLLTQARKFPMVKTLTLELAITFVATLASFYLLERPLLRLKQRFRKVDD